jgi:uncharacterized protein YlaI
MARCCICDRQIEWDDAAVFAMGAAGNPRLLCDRCEQLVQTATLGRDFEQIEKAMDTLGKLMADGNPDRITFETAKELMKDSYERAKAIKDGSYDFSLDEEETLAEDELDEIPEELLESEEDKEQDKIEEEKAKKFDKVYNILLIIVCGLVAATVVAFILKANGIDLTKFFDIFK